MSQIRSFDDALDFLPAAKAGFRTRFGGFIRYVSLFLEAMSDGHAAARRYHELRGRGYPHDKAASKVFSDHFR
jgi:hypothetical protein